MNNLITKIVIVGGGTAGWLSALYLTTILRHKSKHPRPQVTLIESSTIPTIGVGEATIQNIRQTFQLLELDEQEWMVRCNATLKMAIKFVNWRVGNDVFWHPFGSQLAHNKIPVFQHLLKKYRENDRTGPQYFNPEEPLCESRKSPKTSQDQPYAGDVGYGYHLDAGLLARCRSVSHLSPGKSHCKRSTPYS